MKRLTIEIIYADGRTEVKQMGNGVLQIGREGADINLGDKIASGLHGEITVSDENITYRDLDSTNGTYNNSGKKIEGKYTLIKGTELKIGNSVIRVISLNMPQSSTIQMPAAIETPPAVPSGNNNNAGGNEKSSENKMKYKLDLEMMFRNVMKDKNWIVKILIMGLITLIPIAGMLNLMGWAIAIYHNRKDGIFELPEANIGYIGQGMGLFIAYLPLFGAFLAVQILSFIIPFFIIIGALLNFALALYSLAGAPVIMYLYLEENNKYSSMEYKKIYDFIMQDINSYIPVFIAFLVAGIVSGAGALIFFGVIFTAPLGAVLQSQALAEFVMSGNKSN